MTRNQIRNSAFRVVDLINQNASNEEVNAALNVLEYDARRWRGGLRPGFRWYERDASAPVSLAAVGLFVGMIAIWGMVLT